MHIFFCFVFMAVLSALKKNSGSHLEPFNPSRHSSLSWLFYTCVCVCVCVYACVCVSVYERERERASICVHGCVWDEMGVSLCVLKCSGLL